MREKSTETVAASSPTWETLEGFARQSMQQLLQRMLAAHSIRSRRIATETGCGTEISDGFRIESREHPGTEAEPPLVRESP